MVRKVIIRVGQLLATVGALGMWLHQAVGLMLTPSVWAIVAGWGMVGVAFIVVIFVLALWVELQVEKMRQTLDEVQGE